MSDSQQTVTPPRGAGAIILELLKSNWLTLVLLIALGVVLVRDRIPAWQRSRLLLDKPAPEFVLRDLKGKDIRLSDYRGKLVLINFWATWCLPCRLEIPHLTTLYKELSGDDFVLLNITAENEAHVRAFAEKYELEYPILLDPREESLLKYNVQEYPTLVFVNPEGQVEKVSLGLDLLLRWKVRYRVTGSPW